MCVCVGGGGGGDKGNGEHAATPPQLSTLQSGQGTEGRPPERHLTPVNWAPQPSSPKINLAYAWTVIYASANDSEGCKLKRPPSMPSTETVPGVQRPASRTGVASARHADRESP